VTDPENPHTGGNIKNILIFKKKKKKKTDYK